ncbi:hypothetical protein MKW92_002358 [Papaver armeniacum]|nr:hypothetical protein MKW92_002358 [Papaver armeniacum]
MSFAGMYPCMESMDDKDPIRLVRDKRAANPNIGTKVFMEVQVREKRVYRTRSGLLLNHLHVSPTQVGPPIYEYLLSWRWFQIDFDDLVAKDVFRHCCDAKSLLSMFIGTNEQTKSRFLNFFKRRVSSFCNKNAANLIETKPKFVVIVTHITTVCVYDLGDDCEAVHSLKACGKSCVREENPYGATLLPKGAFLFSAAHGSLAYNDFDTYWHGQTCAVCLNELVVGSDDIIVIIMCDHAFHAKCLIPWFNKVGTCPVCRRILKIYATRQVPARVACPP